MSGGWRQPSFLAREECGAAAGEEGWQSRCRDKAGPAPDQPAREAAGAAAGTVTPERSTRTGPRPCSRAPRPIRAATPSRRPRHQPGSSTHAWTRVVGWRVMDAERMNSNTGRASTRSPVKSRRWHPPASTRPKDRLCRLEFTRDRPLSPTDSAGSALPSTASRHGSSKGEIERSQSSRSSGSSAAGPNGPERRRLRRQ